MSQRDCGCPGLVTPTLDELLAVARQKPLPRVRVRERRAPPARVGATMKGWLSWQLIDRAGREVRAGEGPNLILDQGLDQIASTRMLAAWGEALPATFFPLIRYAAVGTDSTAPDPSQTGLGAELARTDAVFATETITRPSPGVYQMTRFIEFDYAVGNGVLAEWGFSSSGSVGSNLFNRALFTDSGGSPDAITKTSSEKLRLTYTLEVALTPVTLTAGSFTVTNVGIVNGSYTLVGGAAPASIQDRCKAPDLELFSALARGVVGVRSTSLSGGPATAALVTDATDRSGITYTSTVNVLSGYQAFVNSLVGSPRDVYVPGSFSRAGGAWKFDTGDGNRDPIAAFLIAGIRQDWNSSPFSCAVAGYAFDLDLADEFAKDDEHTLEIGVPTVTWGRGSS